MRSLPIACRLLEIRKGVVAERLGAKFIGVGPKIIGHHRLLLDADFGILIQIDLSVVCDRGSATAYGLEAKIRQTQEGQKAI